MSVLFKLVLGQKVVHPEAPASKSDDPGAASSAPQSTASNAPSPAKASSSPAETSNGARRLMPSATTDAAAAAPAPRATTSGLNGVATASKTPNAAAAPSPPLTAPGSPRPSTPTRTLLLRIEGCTVAQDIRDALRDLLRCPDLPYAIDGPALQSLLSLLSTYAEDDSITEPALQLLARATDLDAYPSQYESNRRTVEVTAADKRHTRDELLQGLVDAVGVLLASMNATAPFWSRYHAVVLLHRLEEYEPSKVNQALLAARGVGVLLEALNDSENDNALRNEALMLLTSLTLADRELQTLLAFDNAFDSLFDLVEREGGILGGGTVARDSLTVVHNLLRSNKATQKFFREMGCAARLAALFNAIPAELTACTVADQRRGAAAATPSHLPQPTVVPDQLESLLARLKGGDALLNVLLSVSILACVLRGHDDGEAELHATQDALLRCGLLQPLTRLAFCGLAVDDATRIEAVRVLALLLDRSKRALEEWLSLPPVVTLTRSTLPYTVRLWPAPRALLSYVCETTDTTLVNAGVQLFLSVLSVPASQERAVGVLLGGLVGTATAGQDAGSGATSPHSPSAHAVSPHSGGGSSSQSDPQCGSALSRILLSPATSAVEKYYAAQVFRALVSLPAAAKLCESLVRVPVPVELQQGRLNALVKAQPGWTLSSHVVPSFFNYYVSFVLFAVNGGAASQQMNTAALGAYVAALLGWTGGCPWAAAALVQEASWGDMLLHQARRDGAAHVRLWSAMLIARGCVVVQAAASAAAHGSSSSLAGSTTAAAGVALAQRFLKTVGGGAALDTILFDAQASTPAWQHPVTSGLRTQTPTPYDEPFIAQVEQLVGEFKRVLGGLAGSAPASLPPLTHLASQSPSQSESAMPPPYGSSSYPGAGSPAPAYVAADEQQQQPLLQHVAVSLMSSTDYQVPSSSMLSHAGPPLAPPQQQQSSSEVTAALDEVQERLAGSLALVETLQSQLHAAHAEREELLAAVAEWRRRAEDADALRADLQRECEQHRAAVVAAEEEAARLREAAANATANAATADAADELRESVQLLEEALHSKDEEHQQLVLSLNMMEEQLRQATQAASTANELRVAAVRQLQSHAPPQPPPQPQPLPPQQQGPPPEAFAALQEEKAALQQQLQTSRQEAEQLHYNLQRLAADYQQLLLMVAELNEECVMTKAASSVFPTPARELVEWGSTSHSLEREHGGDGDGARPIAAAADIERVPFDEQQQPQPMSDRPQARARLSIPFEALDRDSMSDGTAVAAQLESRWTRTESPTTAVTEMARAASSVDYAEATDVLIDVSSSRPSPSFTIPPTVDLSMFSPPPPQPQPQPQQQQQSASRSLSASSAAARPHKEGGLPNPLQQHARKSVFLPGGRHAPRYAAPVDTMMGVHHAAAPPPTSIAPAAPSDAVPPGPPPPPPQRGGNSLPQNPPPYPPPAQHQSSPHAPPPPPPPPPVAAAQPEVPPSAVPHPAPAYDTPTQGAHSAAAAAAGEQSEDRGHGMAGPALLQGEPPQPPPLLPSPDDFFGTDGAGTHHAEEEKEERSHGFGAPISDAAHTAGEDTVQHSLAVDDANHANPFLPQRRASHHEPATMHSSSLASGTYHPLPSPSITSPSAYGVSRQETTSETMLPPPAQPQQTILHPTGGAAADPAVALPTADAPVSNGVSAYNPFADFGGDDDDGGLADLR